MGYVTGISPLFKIVQMAIDANWKMINAKF